MIFFFQKISKECTQNQKAISLLEIWGIHIPEIERGEREMEKERDLCPRLRKLGLNISCISLWGIGWEKLSPLVFPYFHTLSTICTWMFIEPPFQKISILERANNDLLSLSPNFRVQVNFWPKLRLEDVGISDKLVRNPPTGCKLLFLVGQYPCRMEVELEQKDLNQTRSKNMMREVQMIYSTKRSRPALEQHCSLFFIAPGIF